MLYRHHIVNDTPSGAWSVHDGYLADYSGNGADVFDALPIFAEAIIANDEDQSFRVSDTSRLNLPSTVMDAGGERESFSLEAWFKPEEVLVEIVILGRGTIPDGLVFDGERIMFVTSYANSPESICAYTPEVTDQVFYVVGVHDKVRNMLFVNGELVASEDLTEAQLADTYEVNPQPNTLTSGAAAAPGDSIVVDGFAVYRYALSALQVSRHYAAGTAIGNPEALVNLAGGGYWELTDRNATIAREVVFDVDADWRTGVLSAVIAQNDEIRPELDPDGAAAPGEWRYGFFVEAGILAGSKIEWDADGDYVVETSIDRDATWQICNNGEEIPGLTGGTDSTTIGLSIRITFLAGPDDSVIRSLRIKMYSFLDVSDSRGAQFFSPSGDVTLGSHVYPALSRHARGGALITGGVGKITPYNVPEAVTATATIAGWFRVDGLGTVGATIIDAGGGQVVRWNGGNFESNLCTVFVDGRLQTLNLKQGTFYHLVVTLSAPTTDAIFIGRNSLDREAANVTLSHLATFKLPFEESNAADLYRSYVSAPSVQVYETNTLTLTDSTAPPRFYTYDWSISAGV